MGPWEEKQKQIEKNRQIRIEEMKAILRIHNIEMAVGGCGCCGSPWISFRYEGKTIIEDDECEFAMSDSGREIVAYGINK